ncbi:hypothetical protein D3C80_1933290 [compost metagenome]
MRWAVVATFGAITANDGHSALFLPMNRLILCYVPRTATFISAAKVVACGSVKNIPGRRFIRETPPFYGTSYAGLTIRCGYAPITSFGYGMAKQCSM